MAIPIEGYSVVAQRQRIPHLLDSDKVQIPNAAVVADDCLWRCSFMTLDDATAFAKSLNLLELNTSIRPDSDVVIVNEFDCTIDPYCEWLQTGKWEKAVIGWLAGTEPRTVVAREGWDPKVGSGLTFRVDTDGLELVRTEGNVDVYRDKESGKELYIGRTSTPVDRLFDSAGDIICRYLRTAGESPVIGKDAEQVTSALAMLDEVLTQCSDDWRVHWLKGKGHMALGDMSLAYDSFEHAYALEKNDERISRELAGACLELGKFDYAVEVAERAVALHPDNHELLGNLALAHLLDGHVEAAQKTIEAATKLNSSDQINRRLRQVIQEVVSGRRPLPKTMQELQGKSALMPQPSNFAASSGSVVKVKQRKFWQFWKK